MQYRVISYRAITGFQVVTKMDFLILGKEARLIVVAAHVSWPWVGLHCCVFVLVKILNGFVWIIYHVFAYVFFSIIIGGGWNWDNEITAPVSVLKHWWVRVKQRTSNAENASIWWRHHVVGFNWWTGTMYWSGSTFDPNTICWLVYGHVKYAVIAYS